MDLKLILGVVIVVILLYIIWSYFFTSMEVLMSFQNGNVLYSKSLKDVVDSSRNNYSFSVWTYISDWGVNYGNSKNILAIAPGTSSNSICFFAIYFSKTTNDLNIYVEPANPESPIKTTENIYNSIPATCSVTNFPLQTWVNISVSVYNRAIDVYIDGKLIKTCSMTTVASPISNSSGIFIGGKETPNNNQVPGFSGFIASVVYSPDVFSPKEVWDIYSRGYTNSAFDLNALKRYKLELAFLKDNSVLKSFSI
jgi:hypothetical protein